jgi:hypothetical protein
MSKLLGVLDLEGEPLGSGGWGWAMGAMVEGYAGWDGREKEGHAVVVEGGAPLAHGRVNRVEDLKGILTRSGFAGTELDMLGDGDGCRG